MLMNWSLKVITTFPCKKPVIFEFICQLCFITLGRALFSVNILEIDHSNYLICFLSPLVFKKQAKNKNGRGHLSSKHFRNPAKMGESTESPAFGLLVTTRMKRYLVPSLDVNIDPIDQIIKSRITSPVEGF